MVEVDAFKQDRGLGIDDGPLARVYRVCMQLYSGGLVDHPGNLRNLYFRVEELHP